MKEANRLQSFSVCLEGDKQKREKGTHNMCSYLNIIELQTKAFELTESNPLYY